MPETAKCSKHWVKLQPHKELFETENELVSWCRYGCLDQCKLSFDRFLKLLCREFEIVDQIIVDGSALKEVSLYKQFC